VSLPLISTWGGRPTEKFKSDMLSATDSILSRIGWKSKKLILVSGVRFACYGIVGLGALRDFIVDQIIA
jgi:hypothetical protein